MRNDWNTERSAAAASSLVESLSTKMSKADEAPRRARQESIWDRRAKDERASSLYSGISRAVRVRGIGGCGEKARSA